MSCFVSDPLSFVNELLLAWAANAISPGASCSPARMIMMTRAMITSPCRQWTVAAIVRGTYHAFMSILLIVPISGTFRAPDQPMPALSGRESLSLNFKTIQIRQIPVCLREMNKHDDTKKLFQRKNCHRFRSPFRSAAPAFCGITCSNLFVWKNPFHLASTSASKRKTALPNCPLWNAVKMATNKGSVREGSALLRCASCVIIIFNQIPVHRTLRSGSTALVQWILVFFL